MKRAIMIFAIAVGALGALAIRVVVEGRAAIASGDDWVLRGRNDEAIRAYETAARWYLPLAPHVDDAYAKLRRLAGSTDPALQLAAWRAIRGAARATRTLWTPHADDLAAADQAIAKLSATAPGAATTDESWHRTQLAREVRPGVGTAVLAALGVLAFVAGGIGLARRGIDAKGRLVRRPALIAGAAIVLGAACWLVGLYNA